jgi:aminopeptidase N
LKRFIILGSVLFISTLSGYAQLSSQKTTYTHADSLRGSISKERIWWDALHYELSVKFDIPNKSISGSNSITYKVLSPFQTMQIDLMEPLQIDSIIQEHKKLNYKKDGNAYFINLIQQQFIFEINKIAIYYHGVPIEAINPPWDGGVVWKQDAENNPWVSVACQGTGSSIWFPNKEHQYDEPDSVTMHFTADDKLEVVSNGRHIQDVNLGNGYITHTWKVSSPINNYNIIPYIGKYAHSHESYKGLNGPLDVDLYFLSYDMQKAREHVLPELLKTIEAFEYWFGPYPFYKDGFKMVEAPYLGMEHQSAIAYGNQFKNGYLGFDMSGSGVGLKFDYIVVHETSHEWFGNNITTKDIADMWVHEGFGNYSEVLFSEYWYGKEAADKYVQGIRTNIENNSPMIGVYNVNEEGPGDMYNKGANLIHTIRQVIDNDSLFRQILIGLNSHFYHQVVRTEQIENYISENSGKDFSKVFDQYLRTIQIPQLEYKIIKEGKKSFLSYHWTNCIDGFNMPVKVKINDAYQFIYPTAEWNKILLTKNFMIDATNFVDPNFYVTVMKVE